MKLEMDIKLEKKSLNRFLLYHNYVRFSGVAGVVISLAAAVVLAVKWDFWTQPQRVMLLVLALLFTVLQPLILISKGRKQLSMEEFKIPFHYSFDETGISISQSSRITGISYGVIRKVTASIGNRGKPLS